MNFAPLSEKVDRSKIPNSSLAHISTCHLTREDARLIDNWPDEDTLPLTISATLNDRSGYLFYLTPFKDAFAEACFDMTAAGFSAGLVDNLKRLRKAGFVYLVMSNDHDNVHPQLHQFEWE